MRLPRYSVAGALILLGATLGWALPRATGATWRSQAELPDITIQSGTLNLGKPAITWADVSSDKHDMPMGLIDGGDEGNINSFRIVAGDHIRAAAHVPVTVEGNNLRAVASVQGPDGSPLTLTNPEGGPQLANSTDGVWGTYELVRGNYAATDKIPPPLVIAVAKLGQPLSTGPVVVAPLDDLTVVVDLTFAEDAPDDVLDDAVAGLTIVVRLDQDR